LRNALRYQLSNLYDFDPADGLPFEELQELDRYVLVLLDRVIARTTKAYKEFAFHLVYHELLQFCTVTLSAFYLDIIKDRLYCSAPDGAERRSAQTVLYRLADGLVRLMAPILSFTAEEAWRFLPEREAPSVHMSRFPGTSGLPIDGLVDRWENLRSIRETVNKALEEARQRGEIGKSLEAKVFLAPQEASTEKLLRAYLPQLATLLIVSQVELVAGCEGVPFVRVSKAEGEKCTRCWTVTTSPTSSDGGPLCPRCAGVVGIRA
jgi:isoleucyl-tRNA synthetase